MYYITFLMAQECSIHEFMKQAENKHTIVTPSPEYSLQVYIIPN